jgi:AcrR family transcriptional regulator
MLASFAARWGKLTEPWLYCSTNRSVEFRAGSVAGLSDTALAAAAYENRALALKATKKPPTPLDRDRTIEIYNKAADIFREQGFDATSMSSIASAVDLTKAGLYYYIESKEDLLYAIMDFAMERLETIVIEPSRAIADPQKRLQSILTRHGRLLVEGNNAITILTDEIAGLKPKHRKQILDRKRAYLELVRSTLEALRADGKLRDVNTTVAAFSLFGTLLWLPRWFRGEGELTGEQVIEQIVSIVAGGLLKGKK